MKKLNPMNDRDFALIEAAVKADYLQRNINLFGEHLRSYIHYDMVLLMTIERLTIELNEILKQYLPEDFDNEIESQSTSRSNKSIRDDWHDR